MAISHVFSSAAGAINGNPVTIALTGASTNDVVVAFGGKPGRATVNLGPPSTLGYKTLYTTGVSGTGPNFWVGFKRLGETPDASFYGLGTGSSQDGNAYGVAIFRGVSSVVQDVAITLVNGNSTNPDPPSIITATNGAVVVVPAISQVADTAVFSILGYSDFKFAVGSDNLSTTVATNWASVVTAGSQNPGAYQGWASASWISATVALKPATAPTLTSSVVSEITQTTATGGGNVSDDGGSAILERGVVWDVAASPTTGKSKTSVFGTTGFYQGSITGLSASTSYYAAAYAINAYGSTYGSDQAFSTLSAGSGVPNNFQSYVGAFSPLPKRFRNLIFK